MGADYAIYIEDYVLSYLKREVDSLELSEIFFYGKRENGGRKFLVYGAGRRKDIAAFADYALLDELVCRLTQAGPVFMVREKNGDYRVNGFQTFYADNEAMQNYLIEWTGAPGKGREQTKTGLNRAGLSKPQEASAVRASFETESKKRSGSAISAQLGLILVVLAAIVISSINSYDKMERINRSAREVFFAIENQEAGQENAKNDAPEGVPAGDEGQGERGTEILVERDTGIDDISVEDAVRAENADWAGRDASAEDSETDADTPAGEENASDDTDDTDRKQEEASADTPVQGEEVSEKEDSSEEALSRNITRYYEVERGDTLYTISQKIYGDASRVEKICEMNEISDPDKISEGQKIILP